MADRTNLGSTSNSGEVKFKIGLVGESGVGKSCLLVRWVDDDFFTEDDKYSIGVDYKFKSITVKEKNVKLQIYDTAGQERFRTVTASFYRGAHGILLVYDITDKESFGSRVEDWLKEIKSYTADNTPIVFVGNKCDLTEKRQVDQATAKAFAEKYNLKFLETSAKTGTGVNEAFMLLAEKVVDVKFNKDASGTKPGPAISTNTQSQTVNPSNQTSTKEKKKGPCILI